MSSKAEFTFTWEIENFNLCAQKYDECMQSPCFLIKDFWNTQWCLEIYPRGREGGSENNVSCFLYRYNDDGPHKISVGCSVSINGKRMKSEYSFEKNSRCGWVNFMVRNSVEHHVCILECYMRCRFFYNSAGVLTASEKDVRNCDSEFFFAKSLSAFPRVMIETFLYTRRKVNEVINDILPHSNQVFARSRVVIERKIFISAIKNYLYPGTKYQQPILVEFSSASLLIKLLMSKKDNRDSLEIDFGFENNMESNCVLICKIELVDSERNVHFSAEHLFQIDHDEYSKFVKLFEWSDLKENEAKSLRFTLTFSNGQYISEIEKTSVVDDCVGLLNLSNDVTLDLHRLYIEKRFCDVTIRVQEKSLEAHKAVLCSRSPVFAAMFESGMKENNTNFIEIDDLDSNTVSQMLYFMYTGVIEDMSEKNFMELYYAADKYQIMSMKDICRYALKNKLTTQNICSVLLFLDKHQDEKLSETAIIFISYHKNDILESEEWKKLKKSNACLALETLTKVCLRLSP